MNERKTVAVVTGASRGAGRGIAIALGSHGCTVYVTGRSQKAGDAPLPGTIYETADAVTKAGGEGIPVRVDHGNDSEIKALFSQVKQEQGQLDILVNNAFAAHDEMTTSGTFWEKPLELVDMWKVGLRGAYTASYYAAPILAEQQHGLIAFTSAAGARHYVFGPTYGVHKAGLDKMAADMAVDFRDYNVACLSIWMGALMTERMQTMKESEPEKYGYLKEENMETPGFTGHLIWAAYNDPDLMDLSGKTVIGAELALKYGVTDKDGRQPPSYRDRFGVSPVEQHPFIIR
ncbi:MAG: SDR family NAD(P)-dependent oxidoreductase [Halioglobus sp.]|nr:SDR family NAD(P)-dependent oxidoreductase [Halioglobus sp.]